MQHPEEAASRWRVQAKYLGMSRVLLIAFRESVYMVVCIYIYIYTYIHTCMYVYMYRVAGWIYSWQGWMAGRLDIRFSGKPDSL